MMSDSGTAGPTKLNSVVKIAPKTRCGHTFGRTTKMICNLIS